MDVLLKPAAEMYAGAEIPPGNSPGFNHSYDIAAVHATADVPTVTVGTLAGNARRQIAG